MKTMRTVAALAVASLCLSACMTSALVKDLSPDDKADIAKKFIDSCTGTVSIGANGGTGQMGGGFTGSFQLNGTCGNQVVPLKDFGKQGTGTGAAPADAVPIP